MKVGPVLVFCALVAGVITAGDFWLPPSQRFHSRLRPFLTPVVPQQQCAVYQQIDVHLDVAISLAFVFQEAGCNTSVYLPGNDAGVVEASNEFYRGAVYPQDMLESNLLNIDVLVFTSFPAWGAGELLQRALVRRGLQSAAAATPKPSVVIAMIHGANGVPETMQYIDENSWLPEALNSSTDGKGEQAAAGLPQLGCHSWAATAGLPQAAPYLPNHLAFTCCSPSQFEFRPDDPCTVCEQLATK